jgi:endonuclease VIII-like 1
MPELAECKITSEFINTYGKGRTFIKIEKSPVSKVKTELDVWNSLPFTISSQSRGKEILITCESKGPEKDTKNLLVNLGMSGAWTFLKHDFVNDREKYLKHMHLRFVADNGDILGMIDVRRFAKWKWVNTWSSNRGPCPLTEYDSFLNHLSFVHKKNQEKTIVNRDKHAALCEVLMDQSVFNGVGNYLRAEILYRADIDPFKKFYEASSEEINKIAKLTNECVKTAYELGGGQLKDWKNPEGTSPKSFKEWIKCYSLPGFSSKVDKHGRRFWYDPKWEILLQSHV